MFPAPPAPVNKQLSVSLGNNSMSQTDKSEHMEAYCEIYIYIYIYMIIPLSRNLIVFCLYIKACVCSCMSTWKVGRGGEYKSNV